MRSGGGETPLSYTIEVTPEQDLQLALALDATVGSAPIGAPVQLGLPLKLRATVRLRLDAQTGLVRELWVVSLAVNDSPLLPEQLTRWVKAGEAGPSADAAAIWRALTPWLSSQ